MTSVYVYNKKHFQWYTTFQKGSVNKDMNNNKLICRTLHQICATIITKEPYYGNKNEQFLKNMMNNYKQRYTFSSLNIWTAEQTNSKYTQYYISNVRAI
jgi:hypothetical protein